MDKKPIDVFEDAAIAAQLGGKARKAGVAAAKRQAKRVSRDPLVLINEIYKRIGTNLVALVYGGAVFHSYEIASREEAEYLSGKKFPLLRVLAKSTFFHDPGLKPCNPAAMPTENDFSRDRNGRMRDRPDITIFIAQMFANSASSIPSVLAHRARLDLFGRERFIEAEWAKLALIIAKLDANYRKLNSKPQPEMTLAQSLALYPNSNLAKMSQRDLEIFDQARARAITPSHRRASTRALLSAQIEASVKANVAELEKSGLLSHTRLFIHTPSDNPRQRSLVVNSSSGIGPDGNSFDTGAEKKLSVTVPLFSTSLIPSFSSLVLRARLARLGPEKLVEDSWARAAKSIAEAGESLRAASSAPVPPRLAAAIEARELSATVAKPPASSTPRRTL